MTRREKEIDMNRKVLAIGVHPRLVARWNNMQIPLLASALGVSFKSDVGRDKFGVMYDKAYAGCIGQSVNERNVWVDG